MPRCRRTTAACGKTAVNGPRRENARTGSRFVKSATAAAVCATGVLRIERRRGLELPLGGDAAAERPEREAVAQLRGDVGVARVQLEHAQLAGRGRRRGQADAENERRQVRRELGIEDVLRRHRLRRVRERRRDAQELLRGIGRAPGPEKRPAEMELRARVARMRGDEPLQRVEAVRRPARRTRPRSARRRSGSARRRRAPARACPCGAASRPRLSATASGSLRTPKSSVSGGTPARGFVTAPARSSSRRASGAR